MKFFVLGKGFVYEKYHKDAIQAVGGVEVDNYDEADYIVILTPSYLHYEQIMEALNEGKKVICEKPLVLSSYDCEDLISFGGEYRVFPIMQMRYLDLKINNREFDIIKIDVQVHRDKEFFESWKGDDKKSGGILFNLGIHYIDWVVNVFGFPDWIDSPFNEKPDGFRTDNYDCRFKFSYDVPKNEEKRLIVINDQEYSFETEENLHIKAYRDIINNRGITLHNVWKTLRLLERLRKY